MKKLTYLPFALSALFFAVSHVSAAGIQANIKIEQVSPNLYGTWTTLSQSGTTTASTDKGVDVKSYSFGITEFGQMTLSVVAPPGMSARISVYRLGELVKHVDTKQYSFPVLPNDDYRFIVQYAVARTGSLGVTSEPNKLRFRMKARQGRTYTAVTPHTFPNLPAGKYSLYFPATDDCYRPAVQTVDVEQDKRTVAVVTLTCTVNEVDNVDRSRISRRAIREYVEERELKTRGNRK